MKRLAQEGDILIREMEETPEDLGLFLKWMTDPETMKYWEGMTVHFDYDRVLQNYRESLEEQVDQCLIEYGQRAIGFCQYCRLNARYYEVPQEEYDRFVKPGELVYGIDMFIGEVDCRDRGIGTKSLRLLSRFLFEKLGADVLMIDPKTHNARAIRCYEKSGFARWFVVPEREPQDGIPYDSQIMGLTRERWEGGALCPYI